MKVSRFAITVSACCVGILATTALAHPGHSAGGFAAGLAHPLSGIDHLLAMLAVGMWAVQLGKRGTWMVPAAFVLFMLAGAGLALTGVQLTGSAVEQAIAASLLVTGLLITGAFRMPTWVGVALAALFAAFHGYAHGSELSAGMSAATYGVGFLCTTSLLLATGVALATLFAEIRKPVITRMAGAILVLAGVVLFVSVL